MRELPKDLSMPKTAGKIDEPSFGEEREKRGIYVRKREKKYTRSRIYVIPWNWCGVQVCVVV